MEEEPNYRYALVMVFLMEVAWILEMMEIPMAQGPVHLVQVVPEVVAAEVPAGDPVAQAPAAPAPAVINKRIAVGGVD